MKRVCILIRSLAGGGAEKQALLLAKALQDEHDTLLVVCSEEPQVPHRKAFVERHDIATTFLPRNPVAKLWRLRKLLKERSIDLVFSFLPSDTLLGALAGRWAGTPLVYGGLRNTKLRGLKERVLRLLHNHVLDGTISNSHRAAELFAARGFRQEKLYVVPNGIDVLDESPARPSSRTFSILTVGRLVDQKDHRTALRSVALAARECDDVELRYVVMGEGPLAEEVERWIDAEGLRGVAAIDTERPLARRYAEADVFLSTSLHEGLSNAIMEAMNFGLPIVATDVGDNARLVQHGVNGFLLPPGDVAGLADALSRLARSPELRAELGESSRRILAEGYSYEAFRRTYLGIVDGHLPGRGELTSAP